MFHPRKGTPEYYHEQIRKIIFKYNAFKPETPTPLSNHIFIGNYGDARDLLRLQKLGITHVLNMAAFSKTEGDSPYPSDNGMIAYKQFRAEDSQTYPILKHFDECKEFLDSAKSSGGKALVHCAMGMNRSGAICVAYLMVDEQKDLLEVLRHCKEKRGSILVNIGFQKQLVVFASQKGLLPKTAKVKPEQPEEID